MKTIEYKPIDYTWTIRKDINPNPNTGHHDVILHILEFDIEYDFETAEEAEKNVDSIIKELIKTRSKIQKKPLPIPLKYSKNFTGRITLRISKETHKSLYIEATNKHVSLNHLIETKLAKAS